MREAIAAVGAGQGTVTLVDAARSDENRTLIRTSVRSSEGEGREEGRPPAVAFSGRGSTPTGRGALPASSARAGRPGRVGSARGGRRSGQLDELRAKGARTEGELALAKELNAQQEAELKAKDAEYARLRRRVTAGFTLAVTVLAVVALAAWLGGGDVEEDYRAYQVVLSEKQRTIEALQAVMGSTMIELPDVEPIDVRFVREGGHYVRPADDGYIDAVQAVWDEISLRPDAHPVAFLVSYASHDGASSYNAWVSARRASVVTAELLRRDIFVGAMVVKELSGTIPDLDDKVVRIRIALLTEEPASALVAAPPR